MTRTNIDLDDQLVAAVMERFSLPTKRAAVDFALRRAAGSTASAEGLLSLEGMGWKGELGLVRGDAPPTW